MFAKYIKPALYRAASVFAISAITLTLAIYLLGFDEQLQGIKPEVLIGLSIMSIFVSASFLIFETKLSSGLKILLNWVSVIVISIVTMFITVKSEQILMFFVFALPITVVYFICCGIAALIKKADKNRKIISNWLYPLAAYYWAGVAVSGILIKGIGVTYDNVLNIWTLLKLIVFAAVLTLFRQLFRTKMPLIIKILLHFILSITSFALVCIVWLHNYTNSNDGVVACVIFAAVYLVIAIPFCIFLSIKSKKENDKKEYRRVLY